MRIIALIFCFFIAGKSIAQQCNCLHDLEYLEFYSEHNLPSYYDQVIKKNRVGEYQKFKAECNRVASGIKDTATCIYEVAKYTSFFRDEHLSVNYKDIYYPFLWDNNDTDLMKIFFGREKKYPVTPTHSSVEHIEGVWQSIDKSYSVQIVRSPDKPWEFMGLILKSDDHIYWSEGQLKFTLTKNGKNSFESIYLFPNRRPKVYTATLYKDVLTIGRINVFMRVNENTGTASASNTAVDNKLDFTELSPTTNYLSIPDFSYSNYQSIDAIVNANIKSITSKPNLIIDLRNNRGGGDRSYASLLPLVLEHKKNPDQIAATVYCTDDILKFYEDNRYKNCENKDDSLDDDAIIEQIKTHKGGYFPANFDTITIDTIYSNPTKVAIIVNRWCASTTEGFVIEALQSKKVKIYGENTWGACSYGEWQTLNLPCLPASVNMPTKKMTFIRNLDIEGLGIIPDVRLDPDQNRNWVKYVEEAMEK